MISSLRGVGPGAWALSDGWVCDWGWGQGLGACHRARGVGSWFAGPWACLWLLGVCRGGQSSSGTLTQVSWGRDPRGRVCVGLSQHGLRGFDGKPALRWLCTHVPHGSARVCTPTLPAPMCPVQPAQAAAPTFPRCVHVCSEAHSPHPALGSCFSSQLGRNTQGKEGLGLGRGGCGPLLQGPETWVLSQAGPLGQPAVLGMGTTGSGAGR